MRPAILPLLARGTARFDAVLARGTARFVLAIGWCFVLLLGGLASGALAQTKQEDEFSLDEEPTGGTPPAPAPAPAAPAPALLSDEQALQEEQAPAEQYRKSTDPYEDPKKRYLFVGGEWRYVFLPSGVLEWFLESAPSVATTGSLFGEVGYRKDGFQVTGQVGWMKLNFDGPFQLSGDPVLDTEWLKGKFNFLMFTAAVTWSTSFTNWFALEYGLEGGFALLFGDMIRTEAYKQDGKWHKCPAWAPQSGLENPLWPADMTPPSSEQVQYCDVPQYSGGVPPATNEADEIGAHYNVKAKHGLANSGIPYAVPVFGPRLSLRFKPIKQLVLRVDVPLPVLPFGFVGGLAAQFGF